LSILVAILISLLSNCFSLFIFKYRKSFYLL